MPAKKKSKAVAKRTAKRGKKAPVAAAERAFVRGVIARGEAVSARKGSAGSDLPPGVTHEIDAGGKLKRRRFSLV